MPEISTAGIFQVAFIARQMEQTLRAFFQTTFKPIGSMCAARHARGGLGLQGKWRTNFRHPKGRLGWQTQRLTDNLISFVGS